MKPISLTVFAVILTLFPATSVAQEARAVITGTVVDQQKAAVPSAMIEVKNVDTAVVTPVTTNTSGLYATPPLNPGVYSVTVSASGFKKLVQANVELRVADRRQLDFILEVGGVAETVTVTTEAPPLETAQASLGTVIDQTMVGNLPTFGRNPYILASYSAGVYYAPNRASSAERPFDNGGMESFTINGGRSGNNEFLLDGAPNTNNSDIAGSGNYITFVPPADAVAEMKVQTSLYDAQYGHTGGGVINVALKSGSNTLHGTAYWYVRNNILNANDLASNRSGIPLSSYHWNQPGFQVEGPVYLPKVYNGRNRTFFMFAWERIRSAVPRVTNMHLPTAAQWSGDFGQTFVSGTSGAPIVLYDPLTTVQAGNNFTRTPFAPCGSGGGSCIPQSRIDPMAFTFRKYFPTPALGLVARSVPNLTVSPNSTTDAYDNYTLRADQQISAKHKFSGSFVRSNRHEVGGLGGGKDIFIQMGVPEAAPTYRHWRFNIGSNFSLTSVLSPTMVSTFRAGWDLHDFSIDQFSDHFNPTQLGFSPALVAQAKAQTFPGITIAGYQSIGGGNSTRYIGNNWSFSETIIKTLSSHSVKFGGEWRDILNNRATTPAFANIGFGTGFTQATATADAASGDAFASYLLGYPNAVSSTWSPNLALEQKYYMAFFQDDWRVTQKLTLNLGLRWDYETPITERYNRMVIGFDPRATSTLGSQTLTGGLLFAAPDNRLAYKKDLNNIQPRFGFAYKIREKLVFRGGWGLTYQSGSADIPPATGFDLTTSPQVSAGGVGFVPVTKAGCTGGSCGMFDSGASLFPDGIQKPYGSARGLLTNAGNGISFFSRDRSIPYMHTLSGGFQYQLPFRSVLDISYVGSRSRQQATSRNLNSVTYAQYLQYGQATTGNTLNTAVPNPFAGLLPGTGLNGTTYSFQQSLLPYPQFTGITINGETIGTTRYDSIQVRVEKRLSAGLTALFNGTFSRNSNYLIYQNNGMDARGQFIDRYSGDPYENFSLITTYQVPLFQHSKALLRAALGGWTVSTALDWRNGGLIGIGGAVTTGADPRIDGATVNREFNTCTFNQNTNLRQNCASVTDPIVWIIQKPNTLNLSPNKQWYTWRTPQPINVNVGVFKAFRTREHLRAELRGEAFNALNTPLRSWANTTATSADFGKIISQNITQGNDPRSIQLSMRISF
jgi:hypothetical protein